PGLSLLCSCHPHPPVLHSFPTRRSSDLFRPAFERRQSHQAAGDDDRTGNDQPDDRAVAPVFRSLRLPVGGEPDRISDERQQEQKDRKSTRLNSSHVKISYAVFCLKKKKG